MPLLQTIGSPKPCLDQRWPSKSGFLYFTTPHSAHLKPALPFCFSVVLSASDVEGTDCAEEGSCCPEVPEVPGYMAGPRWVETFWTVSCLKCCMPALLMIGRFLEMHVCTSLYAAVSSGERLCWSSWAPTCRLSPSKEPSSFFVFHSRNWDVVHGMVGVKWSLPL